MSAVRVRFPNGNCWRSRGAGFGRHGIGDLSTKNGTSRHRDVPPGRLRTTRAADSQKCTSRTFANARADIGRVAKNQNTSGRVRRVIAIIIFFVFAGFGQSFSQPKAKTVDAFDRARSLLEAAFPELVGSDEPFVISVRTPFNWDWRLPNDLFVRATNRRRMVREDGAVIWSENELLWSHFMFSRQQLDTAQFYGDRVHSQELEAVAAELGTNPDASDSDLVAALRKRGAHYPPSEETAFTRALKIERFSRALGLQAIRRTTTTFRWRLGNRELRSEEH